MAATAVLLHPTTPPDYHRIISPTLQIPSNPQVSIPVGILACQRDPLLRQINTTVVSCNVSQPAAAPSGKKTKKAVLTPTLPSDPILEVILHDTVIFPEGGGQPTDTGIITTEEGKVWSVVQAKRHGGQGVHYVQVKDGNLESAIQAFTPGSKVIASLDEAGYDRRYDHMSMHTSQHLLSALLETRLNLPTLSWSLTSYPQPCYVEIPRGMSPEEILSIQTEANRLVFEGRKVHIEVEELDRDKERPVEVLESGRAVGRGLPEDYTGGVKRVVIIDGVDKNPCCGTHLPSLHNLQVFLLPHTDALSRSSTTSARLYFLAGPRLIAHTISTHKHLVDTSTILSCGAPLVPERVSQVVEERKKAEKRVGDVETELAKYISRDLLSALSESSEAVFKKHIHRTDDSTNPLGFLSSIASALTAGVLPEMKPHVIILSSSSSVQTSAATTVVLVSGSDDKLVKAAGDALRARLGVKGGGKGQKWSGKFTGVWKESKESATVAGILKEINQ
ncbi:ThrRS/AlaRS common domain-containing protein [Dendrothele bispora CBS 962.96]|uniref:ThrRS/AlaRS common domain-containing protein n=1 Tax=Dendrothele bispora (strain CBS 962.96) TaxID=1314807 RepID=A0A4S8MYR3_DENBC|nr:ThrRS/AlaRS common domain-containing protein [Dendrothele bispora CBS 962.96]